MLLPLKVTAELKSVMEISVSAIKTFSETALPGFNEKWMKK